MSSTWEKKQKHTETIMELEKNRGNAGSRRKLQIIIKILTDIREDISSLQQEKDSIKKINCKRTKTTHRI